MIEVTGVVIKSEVKRTIDIESYTNQQRKKKSDSKKYYKLSLSISIKTEEGDVYSFDTPACFDKFVPIKNNYGYHLIDGNDWFAKYKRLGNEEDIIKKVIRIRKGDTITIKAQKKKENVLSYVRLLSHHSRLEKY